MAQDESAVTLTLFDFRIKFNTVHQHHFDDQDTDNNSLTCNFGMLKQKLRSKNRLAFSNKFEWEGEIDCSPDKEIYDVRISSTCSCILALTDSAFLVIDYSTHQIRTRIKTDCLYFTIEEDYDGLGNDALLTNRMGVVSKYDLKRFIHEKEECKPLWNYSIPDHGGFICDTVNWMNLDGRRLVIVLSQTHIHFIDSAFGMVADTGIPLENDNFVSGCIEVDRTNKNAIYFLAGSLNRYEYVNGDWIGKQHEISLGTTDGLFMDKVSGNLYFSGFQGVYAVKNTGEFLGKHDGSCSGLCIDDKSGLMYVGFGNMLTILR
ncbi:predicted protein [Naegleria gruberi]|uniref:Predicted protein n=1 Tax=Naegleria gruberi TaxID=5762 RepID=D2W2V1_NAEGR|nr:uncharacterized protein NAEGRDRAFT_75722 [Naegleria gruberi]EFC36614.1 predicted protein [Naegleria gruberi]|eukprot:XP_002669358.1 predicted protein [Naegleria gruberi strain NEG-M]